MKTCNNIDLIRLRCFIISACIQFLFLNGFCQKEVSAVLLKKYNISVRLIKDWNKDKNGCLSLRERFTDTIKANKSLIGISKDEFITLFGEPEDEGGNKDCLTYYTGADCDVNKKISKESDNKAWVVFYFKNNKLEGCHFLIN